MNNQSALHQLMAVRMNSIMNAVTEQDADYQSLLRSVDGYSGKLEALHLSKETMKLIDQYVSGYNAIGSRYGMLAYLLGFSDCRELLTASTQTGKEVPCHGLL